MHVLIVYWVTRICRGQLTILGETSVYLCMLSAGKYFHILFIIVLFHRSTMLNCSSFSFFIYGWHDKEI